MTAQRMTAKRMTAKTQLALALVLSLVWAVAFVVGVDRDAFYLFLGVVAAVVVVVVVVVVPIVAGAMPSMPSLPSLRAAWPRPGGIVIGLGVGVVTVVLTHVGYRVLSGSLPGLVEDVARLHRLAGVTPSRLGLVVLIAVAEELLWRGLLLDALRQLALRPLVAVSASALIYAASQVGPRSVWLGVAGLGFGVLWGALRLRAGLAAAVAAHLVWTLAILGLVPLQ